MSGELRAVESASELLQIGLELEGVTFYKVSAELNEIDAVDPELGDAIPSYRLQLLHEGLALGVRLVLKLEAPLGTVNVDAAANYVTSEAVSLSSAVKLEFANEIAIMALLPFMREAVYSLTQRVFGQALVMPLTKRGELSFSFGEAGDPDI